MPTHPVLVPKPPLRSTHPPLPSQHSFPAQDAEASLQPSSTLNEADIDRFATLFSPATPPASPTLMPTEQPPLITHATARPRNLTQGSADSDFGAFVSVPPSQDPLAHDPDGTAPFTGTPVSHSHAPSVSPTPAHPSNLSLVYFDQFTANAKTASERNRREVLDELLQHQDDPMYFLNTHPTSPPSPTLISTPLAAPTPVTITIPTSTDDALAEALASEMTNPTLIRVERGGSVKVTPSPSRARVPLPPRLSGSASPPSISSPRGSSTSLPTSSPPSFPSASASASHPAQASLSRISSSLVSLLPSGRPRSAAPTIVPSSSPYSAPNSISRFSSPFASTTLTHSSPFASTPYIPPTGAPGFAGDRAWDRGFSEVLEQEEKRGLVDPVGLGIGVGTEMSAHTRHGKGRGVTLVGRREGTARVLNEEIADLVRPHLPALTKLPRHWTLLYSLDQHGISLNTLYSRCEPRIPSRAHPNPPKGGLLVIQDARDAIFGAWLSEGVKLEKGGYYGSGESFLWRYHPSLEGERQGRLDVYKWTGTNEYVALCEPGFISFGGGDGHYGLYLDASLLDGSSAPCPTFGNPSLCAPMPHVSRELNGVAKDVSFECVGLEVWGIGQG
ncbi:TLD-domain-containing protein [Lanmaoa asiatica]|nr:TLD-domain-containing protein [Lanmaoa asiatica]